MRIRTTALALVAMGATLLATPNSGASPAPDLSRQASTVTELNHQLETHLRLYPGGTRIGENRISYDHGRFIITYARPGMRAAAARDCPAGWFCFYDNVNYGYPRGQLSDCYWQDLADYGWHNRTESVHNNKPGVVVEWWEHGGPGHQGDRVLTRTGYQGSSPDVYPWRNQFDHTTC